MERFIKLNAFVIIISMMFFACKRASKAEEAAARSIALEHTGNYAPEFNLSDMDGNMVSLSGLRGKYVVIHFATTWCPFCNAEAPHLEELSQNYKDKGVEVLIIDVMEPQKLIAKKLRDRFNLTFPILLDNDGSVSASYAPPGVLPELAREEVMLASNLIIDPEGKIQFMSLLDSRNFDAELIELKQRLDALLAASTTTAMTISDEFIKLKDTPTISMRAGEVSSVKLSLEIKAGYHIQANQVNEEGLIPSQLMVAQQDGFTVGDSNFPSWKEFELEGAPGAFWIFDKEIEVEIPLSIASNQKAGKYRLPANFYYQACDAKKCYFPRELKFDLTVEIV